MRCSMHSRAQLVSAQERGSSNLIRRSLLPPMAVACRRTFLVPEGAVQPARSRSCPLPCRQRGDECDRAIKEYLYLLPHRAMALAAPGGVGGLLHPAPAPALQPPAPVERREAENQEVPEAERNQERERVQEEANEEKDITNVQTK
ncbi:hypothetical protein AK812_SmicGene7485 [Symbiodinium microadriaticum]|uniref:Uncharacterized protein n=1 Tax=Symbiodinium microadriaticum TaxID=2951 RepID=A0A1Q9ENI0_SYMMI|nr:hypothetical protein AK812_SmicGene7485 [Symbiodinium microadriaticum]